MHPILFRIPLPHQPLMLWWGLALAALVAVAYAVFAARAQERGSALVALLAAVGAGVAAFIYRHSSFEQEAIPIYSYGVMLGTSLVVGWYLTLTLAERDGLPKEVMANCYVITALSAVVGSRLLYVVTNLDEFHSVADLFAFRRGGLAVYGGFLGGYLASWAYLKPHGIRLMPWADVAVPSLASGLCITRIGCYLFGCDFGKRLGDDAPAFLQKLGTFPHWTAGALDAGDGSPAFARHLELAKGTPVAADLLKMGHSFPVHPTQIYESLCGLSLVIVLLLLRKSQTFRGQIFFAFTFGYGYLRFLLEILRDDPERGEYGPAMAEHVLIPGALLLMSLGLCFGIAVSIKDARVRAAVRVLGFVPPVVAYVILKPESFGNSVTIQLSTSQWIGLGSALLVSYFYLQFWNVARKEPGISMSLASLGPGAEVMAARAAESESADDEEEEEEHAELLGEPMNRSHRHVVRAWTLAAVLVAGPALADKVAVLPFLNTSAATSADLDSARAATRTAVTSLSHMLPSDAEMLTAQMSSKDGVVDTGQEYVAAGRASSSAWTVVGHVEEHGATYRLELEACQVDSGRIESLAREITPAQASPQIAEMLALLLRPEGLANAPIPWERGNPVGPTPPPVAPEAPPVAPQPPPGPPAPPPPPAVRHAYAEQHPLALGAFATALGALSRPANATGSSAAALIGLTGAYALSGVPGLELRVDFDGAVAGPRSYTVDGGVRYAFPLVPSVRLFVGPEATVGAFIASGADKTARALLQGAGFVALGIGEHFQVEAVGNLAYAAGSPSLALGGGTVRGLVRF